MPIYTYIAMNEQRQHVKGKYIAANESELASEDSCIALTRDKDELKVNVSCDSARGRAYYLKTK